MGPLGREGMSCRRSSRLSKNLSRRGKGRKLSSPLRRWIIMVAFAALGYFAQHAHGAGDAVGESTTSLAAAPNEAYLRRFVRECSTYCKPGVGALDLWLSLEEVCTSGPGVSFRQQQLAGGNALANSDNEKDNALGTRNVYYASNTSRWRWWWSSAYPVAVCAFATTAGLFGGFRLGSRVASVPKAARHPLL